MVDVILLFENPLINIYYYMGFSLSPDLSARDSNIGPRACPRSDIGQGLIDRVMTKTRVIICLHYIDSAKKKIQKIACQHFVKVAETCYHATTAENCKA